MLVKEVNEQFVNDISFTNSIGEFHVPVKRIQYTLLRNKYYALAMDAKHEYEKSWGNFTTCKEFLSMSDKTFISCLEPGIEELKNDLISMGIFDIDSDTLLEYADKSGYFTQYQKTYDDFAQRAQLIDQNLQYQKDVREYRKDTRAKWVGGTFSKQSNYINDYMHQAELGMRNLAEGAGHSVINAFGNMASTANANKQLSQLFSNQEVRVLFNEGVMFAVWNLHLALIDFLFNRLDVDIWDIPEEDDTIRARRLLNNLGSEVLTENERKAMLLQSFQLNPYSVKLYAAMLNNYLDEEKSITEIAEYFGIDLTNEKEKMAMGFLQENIGNSEDEALQAKEELLKFYSKLNLNNIEDLPSYRYINELLSKYDIEYRTVDSVLMETRDEADIARKELTDILAFMKGIQPPTKESTLEYEKALEDKMDEFQERFQSKLKEKYLSVMEKYLKNFDDKFCTISLFKKGTRKEAAKVKALNFMKRQELSTADKREDAWNKLKDYLPKIGLSEEEATEALELLKKKEHEELNGKESTISKISKGFSGIFKK